MVILIREITSTFGWECRRRLYLFAWARIRSSFGARLRSERSCTLLHTKGHWQLPACTDFGRGKKLKDWSDYHCPAVQHHTSASDEKRRRRWVVCFAHWAEKSAQSANRIWQNESQVIYVSTLRARQKCGRVLVSTESKIHPHRFAGI